MKCIKCKNKEPSRLGVFCNECWQDIFIEVVKKGGEEQQKMMDVVLNGTTWTSDVCDECLWDINNPEAKGHCHTCSKYKPECNRE